MDILPRHHTKEPWVDHPFALPSRGLEAKYGVWHLDSPRSLKPRPPESEASRQARILLSQKRGLNSIAADHSGHVFCIYLTVYISKLPLAIIFICSDLLRQPPLGPKKMLQTMLSSHRKQMLATHLLPHFGAVKSKPDLTSQRDILMLHMMIALPSTTEETHNTVMSQGRLRRMKHSHFQQMLRLACQVWPSVPLHCCNLDLQF